MQSIRSTLLLLAAGFAAVKAQNGADISGGDAACPIEEPFRVSTNPDSWWYNICTSYGASWANTCAISGTVEERTLQGTEYLLCSEKY